MSILLPDSEVGQLSDGGGKLSHLLTGDSELCSQPLTLMCLFGKELGLLLATDHKGLWRGQDLEAWKGKMWVRSTVISYLANWGDNVAQRAQHGGQGMNHDPNLHVDAPPFLLLRDVVQGKERRSQVPPVSPLDLGSSPSVRVTADPNQRPRRLSADPSRGNNSSGMGP